MLPDARILLVPAVACAAAVAPTAEAAPASPCPRGAHPTTAAPDSSAWAPPEALSGRIRDEIGRRWSVAAERLRLRWGPVRTRWRDAELTDFRLLGSGRDGSWVVSFLDAEKRRLFSVRLTAAVRRRHPVAARPLERGDTLRAADVRREEVVTPGRPPRRDSVRAGWVARRRVEAGEVLIRPAVSPPAAVQSGARVEVLLVTGSLELSVPGRAAGTAERGESVSVRLETGRRLRGVAVSPGVVRLRNPGGGT